MNSSSQLESIFFAALGKGTTQDRAAFLDEVCAGDDELRRRLERMLEAQAVGFLQEPVLGNPTADYEPIKEGPGEIIGPYKLMEQIGEGGFGMVFVAEQHHPVRRKVALKIIKPGMDTRDVIARFEAERQALALMDHPNIARVFDAGATESGRPYFVMELVRGVPITDYCDQYRLSPRQRLELFLSLCHAIQHAHQKGIIHRDVKPTNVLVTLHDGRPVVKVIDFGVAKALSQQLTERTIYTQFAQMLGTPLYMSPEQAEMSGLDIDTRSDIYSLGVMLYELLTGTTPFDRKRMSKAAVLEIRRILCEEEPPKPSTRLSQSGERLPSIAAQRNMEPTHLSKLVRGDLDWIVMKCLEKDRNRRYETANNLASDIERYLSDEPVHACPPSASYRFRKFARRNKTLLAAGAAIAATLIIGLGISTWMYFRERAAVQVAKANEARATTEGARAQAVSDLLQEMLASADADRARGSDYTVRALLDEFSARLGNQLADLPEAEADIHATIGRAYTSLKQPDQAQPHLERAIKLRRQGDFRDNEKLASILVDYSRSLQHQWKYSDAESHLREALSLYRQQGVGGGTVIHALWRLAIALMLQLRHDEAVDVAQQALELAGDSPETEYPDVAGILHDLAYIRVRQGKFAEAEDLAEQSVLLHRRFHGDHHPETAFGLMRLTDALVSQKKFEAAEQAAREAVKIFRRHYAADHLNVREATNRLNAVLTARGDRLALDALAKEIADLEGRSNSPAYHLHLAQLLLENNQSGTTHEDEARRLVRRAIEGYARVAIDARSNIERRWTAVGGYMDVARVCAATQGFDDELDRVNEKLANECSQLQEQFPDHFTNINSLYHLALVRLQLQDQGSYRQACTALLDVPGNSSYEFQRIWACCLAPHALEDMSAARSHADELVTENPNNGDYLLALGAVLYRDGQFDPAAKRLEQSIIAIRGGNSTQTPVAYASLLLAMTKWQLNERDEARHLLANELREIALALQDLSTSWQRRATLELLRREAQSLIAQDADAAIPN